MLYTIFSVRKQGKFTPVLKVPTSGRLGIESVLKAVGKAYKYHNEYHA